MTRMLPLVFVSLLVGCSDDPQKDPDLGADAEVQAKDNGGVADKKVAADKQVTADKASAKDKDPAKDSAAEKGSGACKAWSQWQCSVSGKECKATCTAGGTPLSLECAEKSGKADCECKKSGVKQNCSAAPPAPVTCAACQKAFEGGCCTPS